MRRWFELGQLPDFTWSDSTGDRSFLQLPQKAEFITWINQYVGLNARLTKGTGDPGVCVGGPGLHVITPPAGVDVLQGYGELSAELLFGSALGPGLIRQYFDKPGVNDGPNEEQWAAGQPEKPKGGTKGSGGTFNISLANYLNLLIATWAGGMRLKSGQFLVAPAPQIWQEWLIKLLDLYDRGRLSPTQVYGFLALVDWTEGPPKLPR